MRVRTAAAVTAALVGRTSNIKELNRPRDQHDVSPPGPPSIVISSQLHGSWRRGSGGGDPSKASVVLYDKWQGAE